MSLEEPSLVKKAKALFRDTDPFKKLSYYWKGLLLSISSQDWSLLGYHPWTYNDFQDHVTRLSVCENSSSQSSSTFCVFLMECKRSTWHWGCFAHMILRLLQATKDLLVKISAQHVAHTAFLLSSTTIQKKWAILAHQSRILPRNWAVQLAYSKACSTEVLNWPDNLLESVSLCVGYLSDGLRYPVAAAWVCQADSSIQTDLVSHKNIHRLGALIAASQCLKMNTNSTCNFSAFISAWLWSSLKQFDFRLGG